MLRNYNVVASGFGHNEPGATSRWNSARWPLLHVPLFLRDHNGDGTRALDSMTVTDADILDAVGNDPKIHHVLGMAESTNPQEVMDAARNLSALACGYLGRSVSVTNETDRVALKRAAHVLSTRAHAIMAGLR